MFHTSCLMHWVLLCEFEMFMKPPLHTKVRRRSRRTKSKVNQLGKDCKSDMNVIKRKQRWKENEELTLRDQICSVFCPDCQGTGLHLEGDELEKPTVSLSEVRCLDILHLNCFMCLHFFLFLHYLYFLRVAFSVLSSSIQGTLIM